MVMGVKQPGRPKLVVIWQNAADICERYEGGESLFSIARSYGVSQHSIRRVLVGHGTHIRRAGRGSSGHRGFSREYVMRMCRMYVEDKKSMGEIADICGISVQGVHYHLEKNGVQLRDRAESKRWKYRHIWDNAEDICRQYREGASGVELAGIYNVTYTTIYNVLRKYGVSRRTVSDAKTVTWSPEQIRDICSRYLGEESMRSISIEYGVSIYSIRKIIVSEGIDVRATSKWSSSKRLK